MWVVDVKRTSDSQGQQNVTMLMPERTSLPLRNEIVDPGE